MASAYGLEIAVLLFIGLWAVCFLVLYPVMKFALSILLDLFVCR